MTLTARKLRRAALGWLITVVTSSPQVAGADTVASLLGNFTVNQYCGLHLANEALDVHYVVVYGQLPALRELHAADADRNGVTTQTERDAYVGARAPGFADGLILRVDGVAVPLHATRWTSSLPAEQGGFSLRVEVDFEAVLPAAAAGPAATATAVRGAPRTLDFANENFAGQMGWHEIVVEPAPGISVYDTNAFDSSLTGGLVEALQTLPAAGPLDERVVHLRFGTGDLPVGARRLGGRSPAGVDPALANAPARANAPDLANAAHTTANPVPPESGWITRRTRQLVNAISSPTVEPGVAFLTLLGALVLGAVHALSPGHGKSVVGAYLIGSRGTPRHAVWLGVTVTVTHTLGVFALGFVTLYASRFIVPERLFPILSLVSAVLVLAMGVTLLIRRGRSAREALTAGSAGPADFVLLSPTASVPGRTRHFIFAPVARRGDSPMHSHGGSAMHSHGGGTMHSHLPPGASGEKITWRGLLALGISGGLVPCPAAMVLLLAAVSLNKTAYGMLLVVAFSVGLAITLILVGLVFLYARNRFARSGVGSRWTQLMPVFSAAAITVLGAALCFGALKTFS